MLGSWRLKFGAEVSNVVPLSVAVSEHQLQPTRGLEQLRLVRFSRECCQLKMELHELLAPKIL